MRQLLRLGLTRLHTAMLRGSTALPARLDPTSPITVSLTSFPARIDLAWVAVESMFRQTHVPARIILVLAADEFSGRALPRILQRQARRGLEVMWIDTARRAYGKLLPVRSQFPDATIVTIDDDVVYPRRTLQALVEAHARQPHAIVGHRGWRMRWGPRDPEPYVSWRPADMGTPSALTFLTGVGGILYPPHVLPLDILCDDVTALRVCPTNDDVWYWAVSKAAGVPRVCLGNHRVRETVGLIGGPSLGAVNVTGGANDAQLRAAIEHFAIRGEAM